MAATPTATSIIGKRHPIAGGLVHIAIEITGGSTVSAVEVGLKKIIAVWTQDVDDNAQLVMGTYAGSNVVADAEVTASKKQVFNLVGF
jgi:hypothetical protein